MEKKEFKVGEVFDAGLVRLKCVEPTAPNAGEREDNRDVIFIKAD